AQYLSHVQSDRLAARLRRLGYNAVRFHHYESELVDRSQETSTRLNPQALDQLDYLFAALKKNGIYVTTDLFVSRPIFAREVWEDAEGDIGMDEFKMAVPVNERAFANYKTFSVALLSHKNPYTGLRWGEDPTLAWLHLINEGNPGNFIGSLSAPLKEDYARAWNRWLALKFPTRPALTRFLGSLRDGEDPAQGTVPMPTGDAFPYWLPFNIFLADNQQAFFERTHAFLRRELNCRALLSNMNAWTNPVQIQAVRRAFDYVDDHFYVDHPEFIERPWQLPSRCSNNSPVAEGAPGGRPSAFLRLMDKPFTESEFNYSGPSRFRSVGGILTGALGALQDWSVIWRFAYSHNRENLFAPAPAGYFDMASDPLNQAADRASICLFRRGDLKAAPHAVAIAMSPKDALGSPKSARGAVPSWHGLALVTRVGSVITDQPGNAGGADLMLPLGWAIPQEGWKGAVPGLDPYAPDTGDRVLAEMRRRGWVSRANPTDMKASRFQSETGELTVDGPADILTLNTARTCGGYAPAGRSVRTRPATIKIEETDATVWVSSLDEAPIASSRRLLITHLTDLQNSNARFADKARKILLDWGELPHLVKSGKATVTLRLEHPEKAAVWGLETDGTRAEQIPARVQKGALVIPLDIDRGGKARMLYEVAVR
ncbi:MAG: hypothetical protein IT210_15450, partial [Armatimonadetes bacterium]|nr:hypothetical protein [Armatimonadota bacterium]